MYVKYQRGENMFNNIYIDELHYKEYIGLTNTGQPSYKAEETIKGLRLKGKIKVVTSKDGDSTSCDICYKTPNRLIPLSTIDGRTIMECVKVAALGHDCGYVSYVK
jgi:hypothetical protein